MKMTFEGWGRAVYTHPHKVRPMVGGSRNKVGKIDEPLEWSSALRASGKVQGLSLGGDFKVTFDFDEAELRNWLLAYLVDEPEAAIRLLAEMQAEAQISLVNSLKEQDDED